METSAQWFSKMANRAWIFPQVDFNRIFWPPDSGIECCGKGFARENKATDSCRHRQPKHTHGSGSVDKGYWRRKELRTFSTYRQRDCDGGVCDIYVALHIISILSEFFTVIYIFSCPWQEITIAPANRHASASACFGHNATALLPHCANTSARRLTAPALTNIGERGLNEGLS